MTHEDFIAEYLEAVEGDSELKPEPVRFNHYAHQKANEAERPVVVAEEEPEFSMDCAVCSVDTGDIDEYYMVQFDLWKIFVPKDIQRKMLCIGCLEGFLGRQLVSEDFTEAHVNYSDDKSERLLDRMGDWFRIFDGPFDSEKDYRAAITEVGRRMDGLVKRDGPKYLVTVHVDTNNIVRGGLTKASLRRVIDEVKVGDTVLAHDYAEAADFFATVEAIEGKKLYLKLDWDSAVPW
jgi:hypothetical protein